MKRGIVAHGAPVLIDDGQRESGSLQQRAGGAQFGERRDARRRAAGYLGFGGSQRLAQFGQRVAAEKAPQKQAVGFQRAADLRQYAREVVAPVQRKRRDGEVDACRRQRQRLLIADDVGSAFGEAVDAHDAVDLPARPQPLGYEGQRAADVGGERELPLHRGQSIDQIVGDCPQPGNRRPRTPARRARRPRRQGGSVEEARGAAHGGVMGRLRYLVKIGRMALPTDSR